METLDLAFKFVNETQKNIFLTGKAGTGKTTFLKNLIENTHKKALVVAPTGVAAINAGGVTIHSLFQLPFGSFLPVQNSSTNQSVKINTQQDILQNFKIKGNKKKLLEQLELLVIDEVSMLRSDVLDAIDFVLRFIRKKRHLSMGGVQVLFIGDLLQLPPVISNLEWSVLKDFYKSPYFFDAKALENNKPIYVELDKVFRQKDEQFINVLNNFRNHQVSEADLKLLNRYHQPNLSFNQDETPVILTTHNHKAQSINQTNLDQINSDLISFDANVVGDFKEGNFPIQKELELKKGAKVMFVVNDTSGAQRFFNGKIGKVVTVLKDLIVVDFEDGSSNVEVEKHTWENLKYEVDETTQEIKEKVVGTFTAYPLRLAWAITVHKSQGLTFDRAVVDLEGAFASGQIYVALSRLRSLDGLILSSPINTNALKANLQVKKYSENQPSKKYLEGMVTEEAKKYFINYMVQSFNFESLLVEFQNHVESYTKAPKKSEKIKHSDWAMDLYLEVQNLIRPSQAFQNQIKTMTTDLNNKSVQQLFERLKAAKNYFTPLLQEYSDVLEKQLNRLEGLPKINKYQTEISDLEGIVFQQKQQIKKALGFCDSLLNDKAFTKRQANKLLGDEKRNQVVSELKSFKKKTSPKKDTKKISLTSFKEGKSIEAIAKERSLTEGTVFNHLAHFVLENEIEIKQLVSDEKIEKIKSASSKSWDKLSELKNYLGAQFSYDEIKLSLKYLEKLG